MIYVLYTIHILVCLFLILVVLLQQGKGADLSVFGGGATQAAFGARGAVSLLHKLTVWGFIAFIVTTVSIGFMTASRKASSVMSDVPETEQTAPAAEEEVQPAAADQPPAGESRSPAAGETAADGGANADETGDEPGEGSSDAQGEAGEAAGGEVDDGPSSQ